MACSNIDCGPYGSCFFQACICKPGYSQFGDMSLVASNPCDIHVDAVVALWALVFLSTILMVFFSIWGLRSRWRAEREMKVNSKTWHVVALPVLLILITIASTILSIGKFHNKGGFIIGIDFYATLAFCFYLFMFSVFLMLLYLSFVKASVHSKMLGTTSVERENIIKFLKQNDRLMISLIPYGIALAFSFMALLNHPEIVYILMALFGWLGYAIPLLYFGVYLAPRHIIALRDSLTESINKTKDNVANDMQINKMKRIIKKMNIALNVVRYGCPISSVIIIVATTVPYLVLKSPYFIPISFCFMQTVACLGIWVTTTTTKNVLKRPSLNTMKTNGNLLLNQGKTAITAFARTSLDATTSIFLTSERTSDTTKKRSSSLSPPNDSNRGKSGKHLKKMLNEDRVHFTNFVREKYASELIVCYDKCEKYVQIQDVEKRKITGNIIYDDHIAENAPLGIDVPADLKIRLTRIRSEGAWEKDTFDGLSHLVFDLLKSNFYHQFIKESKQEDMEF